MCFGKFDLLHSGHIDYFKQAKSFGEHLTVVIARDKNVQKQLMFNEVERKEIVSSVGIVDLVLLGDLKDYYKVIVQNKPNIICLGYDHKINERELESIMWKKGVKIKVYRMKPYKENIFKSSIIKKKLIN